MQDSTKSTAGSIKRATLASGLALFALAPIVAMASPAKDVAPTLIMRSTFKPFQVKTDPNSPVDFRAKSKVPMDILVRQHDYKPGGYTGWHTHPGPVFITVTKGELRYYLSDDPSCKAHVVKTGETFVDEGGGHMVRNETAEPAQDISVIMAPDQLRPFRGELPAPDPDCGF